MTKPTTHPTIYVNTTIPKTTANIEFTNWKYEWSLLSTLLFAIPPKSSVPLNPISNAYPVNTNPIILGKPDVIKSETFCFNDNAHYNVELKQYGLANYKYNTSNQFGYLATFDKIYFILIQNQETPKLFNTDKVLTWGAIYDYYLD